MDNKNNMTPRDAVVYYDMPLHESIKIMKIEDAVFKLAKLSFDIGSFCYAVRQREKRDRGKGRSVDLSSICPKRTAHMVKLAVLISEDFKAEINSRQTLATKYNDFEKFLI